MNWKSIFIHFRSIKCKYIWILYGKLEKYSEICSRY